MEDWRIWEHPILRFDRGGEVTIFFEGRPLKAYENESVAAALYANGIRVFSRSMKYRRPRGFFCAIGRCNSCMMEVDGVPNVRTCLVKVREGMRVKRMSAPEDKLHPILNSMSLSPLKYLKSFTKPNLAYGLVMRVMRRFSGLGSFPKRVPREVNAGEVEELSADVLVVGAGPAGLSATVEAGQRCKSVVLIDDKDELGGQLIKQTHMFFSDVKYAAGKRGFKLGEEMVEKISRMKSVKTFTSTSAVAYYPNENVLLALRGDRGLLKVRAKKYIVSTGAYERMLVFENNDLPGVYGAGGVQTLLNVYGIKPGKAGLMVGTGNVGLIVTYHLLQAGVNVKAIVAPSFRRIRGYFVHAAKVTRLGVPIITRHTVIRALGKDKVEGAVIAELDKNYNPTPGTEKKIDCDFICLAIGLNPTYDLVQLFKPKMVYEPDLGGFVPLRDKYYRVRKDVYAAGDCVGIEEATTAVLEGGIAGVHASISLGYDEGSWSKIEEYTKALEEDRGSPFSAKINEALKRVMVDDIEEVVG